MKHLLKFLTGGLGLALILSGCGEKKAERSKFAVVTTGVASFWDICKIGAEKAGADLDVDVEVLMPNGGLNII